MPAADNYPFPTYRTEAKRGARSRGAVFFDRDGTLIHDFSYLSDPEKVALLPGVRETLGLLRGNGFLLFLFTNQSGVGRGLFSLETVAEVNLRLSRLLGADEEYFDGVCIAPEHPDGEQIYRKPSPRFIIETIGRFSLDRAACFMVGDRKRDLDSAIGAGITPIHYSGDIQDEKAFRFVAENSIASVSDFREIAEICLNGAKTKTDL